MTKEEWEAVPSHLGIGYDDDEYWVPLCGTSNPEHFTYVASVFVDYVNACPDCLAHPDLPLYLLGDLP